MNTKHFLTVAILASLTVLLCLWGVNAKSNDAVQAALLQPERHGAWLDSLVFTEQGDSVQAIAQLQANELDVYASTVADPALYQMVLEDSNLTQTESHDSYNELSFNPWGPTFDDGRLNPFSNAKIREAMNWLIDRDKIAQEIFGGLAVPKYTTVQPVGADYERYRSTIEAIETDYAYNFSLAQTAITSEMLGMGATFYDDTWYYNGEPVTVIFIIRVEDERLAIGDYVSAQLEAIGFTVDRQYMTRRDASEIWLKSAPKLGQWHIYTGGWLDTNISRDDATNFGFFYTPRGSGGTGDVLWPEYKPTVQFDELCEKLWVSDFTTMSERNMLFEQALTMAMNDSGPGSEGAGSIRVWLVEQINFSPQRTGITVASDLVGRWANEASAGVASADMFPYVARFDGLEGGNLRIAQPGLLVDSWNPIAGSSWIYDKFPIKSTADQALLSDPNTGLYWPERIESADCVIKAGLPVTKTLDWVNISFTPTITIPTEAWVDWDASTQTFITAGDVATPTLEASTKCMITYPADLFNTVTWHDGTSLSAGDFILNMILLFDRANPESAIYDESYVPVLGSFMSHFRGVKIESINPLVITTYDDLYNLDVEWIAYNAAWWPGYGYYGRGDAPGAWHNLTPAIRAEEAGELAFSRDKADQLGIPWTNFIDGESLTSMASWMDQSASEHYIPYLPTMGTYVDQPEADARWAALQTWFTEHNHFWLGTGPFYLDQISYDPKSLTLAHYDVFPDISGRWDAFTTPAQPVLVINHTSGAPGSYFNVTGTGFPADSLAMIVVNNRILDRLMVDSSGVISFTLSTDQASPGVYHIRLSVNPTGGLQFTLDDTQPVHPREGELPIIELPSTFYVHMPMVSRN